MLRGYDCAFEFDNWYSYDSVDQAGTAAPMMRLIDKTFAEWRNEPTHDTNSVRIKMPG